MNSQLENLNTEKKLWEEPQSKDLNINTGPFPNTFEGGDYTNFSAA